MGSKFNILFLNLLCTKNSVPKLIQKSQKMTDILPNYFSEKEKEAYLNLPILELWKKIEECRNVSEKFQFENIGKLGRICLTLQHSNASLKARRSCTTFGELFTYL